MNSVDTKTGQNIGEELSWKLKSNSELGRGSDGVRLEIKKTNGPLRNIGTERQEVLIQGTDALGAKKPKGGFLQVEKGVLKKERHKRRKAVAGQQAMERRQPSGQEERTTGLTASWSKWEHGKKLGPEKKEEKKIHETVSARATF